MTQASLLRRPGKVLNQNVQLERRAAAARQRAATIYDFPSSIGCSPVQLRAFDREIGNLHGAVAVANHDIYGDPLPDGIVVQRKGGDDSEHVHSAAERGVKGGGGRLPYIDRIQSAFGAHDVSGIAAHVGGAATEACDDMGASAYATGSSVAFRGTPDLHTAAHEAAHIVQQRAGVSLKGGVGAVGDRYEVHADRVADLVVRGESAEQVLDEMVGGRGGGHSAQRGAGAPRPLAEGARSKGVQRKPQNAATIGLDPKEQTFAVGGVRKYVDLPLFYAPILGPLGVKGSLGLSAGGELGNAWNGKKLAGKLAFKATVEIGVDVGLVLVGLGATLGAALTAECSAEAQWGKGFKRIELTGVKISTKINAKLGVAEMIDHEVVLAKGDILEIGKIEMWTQGKGWQFKTTKAKILNPALDRFVNQEYPKLTDYEKKVLAANEYVAKHPHRGDVRPTAQ